MEDNNHFLVRTRSIAPLEESVASAAHLIASAFGRGNKLLVCGNGGSSADSNHIVSELMKSFELPRPLNPEALQELETNYGEQGMLLAKNLQQGLPAISLSAHTALLTAISNDMGGEYIFAQQVTGYGKRGDVLLAISTSGNSLNVCNALIAARASGLVTVGLTGKSGGEMKQYCDVLIRVPEAQTASVQEYHLPVFHAICRKVEKELFA